MTELRTCSRCGNTLALNHENYRIARRRVLPSGEIVERRATVCRPCDREASSARQKQYTERQRELRWGRQKRNREKHGRNRAAEYEKRKQKRAEAAGHSSPDAYSRARQAQIEQYREEKRFEKAQKVCWLWNKPGITWAEKYKIRYALDHDFALRERLRRQMNKKAKRDGISDNMRAALTRNGNSPAVERILGYTIPQLRAHLEMQFTKGMTWEKFKAGEIHIDHILPQSSFNLADDDEWKKCWCMSNLRPMWAKENIAKSDKVLYLI